MRNILVDIHYFDYILYKYIERVVLLDAESFHATYYATTIERVKNSLDRKGYMLEEETAIKYVIYLIQEGIIKRYYKEDAELKFCSVFEEIEKTNAKKNKLAAIKKVVLWGYRALTKKEKYAEANYNFEIDEREYAEALTRIFSTAKLISSKNMLFPVSKRKIYLEKIKEVFYLEVDKMFRGLNMPIMCVKEKEETEKRKRKKHLKEFEKSKKDLEIIAEEITSTSTKPSRFNKSVALSCSLDEICRKQGSVHNPSIFDTTSKGQEIVWNDSSGEEIEKAFSSEPPAKTLSCTQAQAPTRPQNSSNLSSTSPLQLEANASLDKKKRKVWAPDEEEALIKAVERYGRCWSIIRTSVSDFKSLTPTQIRDKYRVLEKKPDRSTILI